MIVGIGVGIGFPSTMGTGGGLPALPDGWAFVIDPSDGAYLIDPDDGAYLITQVA